MKARIILMASALGLLSLAGCATSLDSGAEKVQIVTATQKERS